MGTVTQPAPTFPQVDYEFPSPYITHAFWLIAIAMVIAVFLPLFDIPRKK